MWSYFPAEPSSIGILSRGVYCENVELGFAFPSYLSLQSVPQLAGI